MLLVELGRRVHVARVGRRVLADRLRRQTRGTARAARLETAGIEIGCTAWLRADRPMRRTPVVPLAVDDHARRQHEAPAEAPARERAQNHRGAEVVVRDVVGHVEEVDPQPDHPGLVADVVDAGERALDGIGVADIPSVPRVEHADVVAAGAQRVGDVPADEAGASGDEHEHELNIRPPRRRGHANRARSASRNGIAFGPCLGSGAP